VGIRHALGLAEGKGPLARRLLGPYPEDVVMLTAPLFSSFLAAPMLGLCG
jgi:hypothetical protein